MRKQTALSKAKAVILVVLLFLTACSSGGGAKQEGSGAQKPAEQVTTLKLVSFLPMNHPFTKDMVPMWSDMVKEATGGAVKIEWIGGPESIPTKDQFDAVRNGIADVGFNVSSYYGNLMPESLSLHLSPFTPAEERTNGYYDYMADRFKKNGIIYLGRWLGPAYSFYFWSNKEITKLDALKGLKFRSNPTYNDVMVALGINPVEIVPADVFTSLERKMVDGFGFPLLGPRSDGWTEVTKYIINEPFLNQNGTILINPTSLSKLSQENQQKLFKVTAEFEKKMGDYFNKAYESEWKEVQKAGVKEIKLDPAESKKFKDLVQKVKWESMAKSAPAQVEQLKKLLIKQ